MTNTFTARVWSTTAALLFALNASGATPDLIPLPKSARYEGAGITLKSGCAVALGKGAERIGAHFAERLARGTGWSVATAPSGIIRFEIAPVGASPESYRLTVTPQGIRIVATGEQGLARGAETLLQMFPAEVYGKGTQESISLPGVTVEDEPRWAWRGLHLDVSRRFQNKDAILRYLDGMASVKLNVFHWHLTDDQGWRLPIEGYPKLTADKKNSYTREDIREVVAHAAELGITILPEIDMPGHSAALIRNYPELAALDAKGRPAVINAGDEAVYAFIEKVMGEIVTQFPESPYIHIGADEVGQGAWAKDAKCAARMKESGIKSLHGLQTYFVNRVADIIKKKGRKTIAWNEAFGAELAKDVTIMSWQDPGVGAAAVKAGHDVIFATGTYCYFDHRNARTIDNPPGYGAGVIGLNLPYFFDEDRVVADMVKTEKTGKVLGGEACVWGEMIRGEDHMFRMAFPRACALGESQWSPRETLNWESFLSRLPAERKRLAALKVACNESYDTLAVTVGSWKASDVAAKNGVLEFPVKGLIKYPGTQEFVVAYGAGEGRFRVTEMELIKDGVSAAIDKHPYDTNLIRPSGPYYVLTTTEPGDYTLRLKIKQLSGDCSGLVQIIPFVAPERYPQKDGKPEPSSNISKQTK